MRKIRPKKDLWTEAVDAMNSKYHLTIDPAHLDRLTVLKEIETDAGKSKEFREGRLFKFTNHKGKEVLLGDVVDGIVTWVSKSVTIGDTIVQYDPVHAALLWAAVRLFSRYPYPFKSFLDAEMLIIFRFP